METSPEKPVRVGERPVIVVGGSEQYWNNGTEDPELAIASEGDELDEHHGTGHRTAPAERVNTGMMEKRSLRLPKAGEYCELGADERRGLQIHAIEAGQIHAIEGGYFI